MITPDNTYALSAHSQQRQTTRPLPLFLSSSVPLFTSSPLSFFPTSPLPLFPSSPSSLCPHLPFVMSFVVLLDAPNRDLGVHKQKIGAALPCFLDTCISLRPSLTHLLTHTHAFTHSLLSLSFCCQEHTRSSCAHPSALLHCCCFE